MTVTIVPFIVKIGRDCMMPRTECVNKERLMESSAPITYWGIYLDNKPISFVSNKERAERTKEWMEKWFRQI